MESLKTIQTLSKIGRVISKIVFIVSLVGVIISTIGILGMVLMPKDIQIGGMTIKNIIETNSEMPIGVSYIELAISLVYLILEMIIAKRAEKYFTNEIEAGTPFTYEGAKEIKDLGIAAIVFSIIAAVTGAIIYGILNYMYTIPENSVELPQISIGLGIFFIVLSVIFKYGAEVLNGKKEGNGEEKDDRD